MDGPGQQSKQQNRSAAESREQYQKRIQAKLVELGRRISALEAKEENQANGARSELEKQMRELAQQHQAAARQFEDLKLESRAAWEKTKPKMDTALDELERAYRNLASRFQDR